jgi:hypothetical protein
MGKYTKKCLTKKGIPSLPTAQIGDLKTVEQEGAQHIVLTQ